MPFETTEAAVAIVAMTVAAALVAAVAAALPLLTDDARAAELLPALDAPFPPVETASVPPEGAADDAAQVF